MENTKQKKKEKHAVELKSTGNWKKHTV